MRNVLEPLDLRVLRVIEELLKDKPPGARSVDADSVVQRMREPAEAKAEVAEAMGQLVDRGDIRGKTLTGDNQVLDVTVTGITPNGLMRLLQRLPIFSPEQRARITAAINERLPEGKGACPYCGRDKLQLADGFIIFSSVRDLSSNYSEAILSGGPALPCVALVCSNCGNTVFLNVIALGLRDMLLERSL